MLTVRRLPRARVAVSAALVSLESTAAHAAAHGAAGGEVPAAWWLAAFAALVYGAGHLVLRRRAGLRLVVPALLGVQVVGHAWLVALTPTSHADHGHAADGLLGLTPGMLAAHVAAALVAGAMWALRRRAVEVLVAWSDLGVVPAPRRPASPATRAPRVVRRLARLLTGPTRGPPRPCVAPA